MKINIQYKKLDILFITATLGIFRAMLNTIKQAKINKKRADMLNYIKSFIRFHSHNIYYVGKHYTSRTLSFLVILLPLFNVIGDILAVMSIFALGYIFLHFGQPLNPWTP